MASNSKKRTLYLPSLCWFYLSTYLLLPILSLYRNLNLILNLIYLTVLFNSIQVSFDIPATYGLVWHISIYVYIYIYRFFTSHKIPHKTSPYCCLYPTHPPKKHIFWKRMVIWWYGWCYRSTIHDISMNPKAHPAAAHGDRDPAALWAQERNACEARSMGWSQCQPWMNKPRLRLFSWEATIKKGIRWLLEEYPPNY